MAEQQIEARAREMGWVPKEEFKGKEDRWVDAEQYVERGEHILPIAQANNRRLIGEVGQLKGELGKTQQILAGALESLEEFKKYAEDDKKKAVERAIAKLRSDKSAAIKAGDGDAVVEIDAAIDEIKDQQTRAPVTRAAKVEAAGAAAQDANLTFQNEQWWKDWSAENGWYGHDFDRTVDLNSASVKLARRIAEGKETAVRGREFLDRAVQLMAESASGSGRRAQVDKVEGSRGGGGQRSSSGKSYSDLPADAKAACDKYGEKLIGEGKMYKTPADWRAKYAADYFADE